MAGVGFSLRRLAGGDTYAGLLRLYVSAGVISSGPWLISILTLLFVGLIAPQLATDPSAVERFQVSVTWLFAASLLLSTPFQLLFTRHMSDLLYAGRDELTTPNLWGAIAVMSAVGALTGLAFLPLFAHEPVALQVVLIANLVLLSDLWLVIVALSALKEHAEVVKAFSLGYAVTFASCIGLARYGELGLLSGFLVGQTVLLWWGAHVVTRRAPGSQPIAFDFLRRRDVHLDLLAIGALYGLGVWADKFVFWLYPATSRAVLGPFRASEVYDLPVFLAYLSIAPGMAAFLLRIETDYAERHASFFRAIEDGSTLAHLERLRNELVESARQALRSIFHVQGVTFLFCVALGKRMLGWAGISRLHLPLLLVDLAAVGMQVLFLSTISILFYLDRRRLVLQLVALLFVTNLAGTLLSVRAGAAFYGYGFAAATTFSTLVALAKLSGTFRNVLQDAFMMQA